MQHSNTALGHVLQRNENLCSHRNSYMNICSSLIHNRQKLETISMSLHRWGTKQTVVHRNMEHYSALKKNWYTKLKTDLKKIILRKKKSPSEKIWSIYITFLTWQNDIMENRLVVARDLEVSGYVYEKVARKILIWNCSVCQGHMNVPMW